MFENLSNKLDRAFKVLKGQGRITEINVASTIKEIRRALIDADVNYKIAKSFVDSVKVKALGSKVLTSLKPGQLMIKIVQDELTKLLGGNKEDLKTSGKPAVVLLSGLQGCGKTTFSAKLAKKLKHNQSKKVLLVACDVYRPAAIEQLEVLGEQIDVKVFSEVDNKNPVSIARKAIKHAIKEQFNVVIIDTAGRLAIDELMMEEIQSIKNKKPTSINIQKESIMGGMSCGDVSSLAWEILKHSTNYSISISDEAVATTVALLKQKEFSNDEIIAGECGVPGVISLISAIKDKNICEKLKLNSQSNVLLIGCEGLTDFKMYNKLLKEGQEIIKNEQ